MSIALSTLNGILIDVNRRGWEKLLKIAAKNGWKPMGTIPHKWSSCAPEEWDGNYFSADHQTVCAEDVLGIAAALELAAADLDEIPVDWVKDYINVDWIKKVVDICRESGGILIA